MNRLLQLLFLVALWSTPITTNAYGEQEFEGKVVYKRIVKNDTSTYQDKVMIYQIKGDKLRVDFFSNTNTEQPFITRIVNGQTMEISVLANCLGENQAVKGKIKTQANTEKMTVSLGTGTKTINGYVCRQIITQSEGLEIVSWVANLDFDYNKLVVPIMGTSEGMMPVNVKGIPLETTIKDMQRGKTIIITASSIEKKAIEESKFQIPKQFAIRNVEQ